MQHPYQGEPALYQYTEARNSDAKQQQFVLQPRQLLGLAQKYRHRLRDPDRGAALDDITRGAAGEARGRSAFRRIDEKGHDLRRGAAKRAAKTARFPSRWPRSVRRLAIAAAIAWPALLPLVSASATIVAHSATAPQ